MLTVCKITGHFGTRFRNCAEDCLSLEAQVLTLQISYNSVLKTLWNAAVEHLLWTEVCSLHRNKKACVFPDGWLHQPITQLRCRTDRESLCVVQAALSQSQMRPRPGKQTQVSMELLLSLSKGCDALNRNTHVLPFAKSELVTTWHCWFV